MRVPMFVIFVIAGIFAVTGLGFAFLGSERSSSASVGSAPKIERHLGEEFAIKYMTDKFHVLNKPDCVRWEDNGYGFTQSVICVPSDLPIAIYCKAGGGELPTCKVAIDNRVPPPQSPPTDDKKLVPPKPGK